MTIRRTTLALAAATAAVLVPAACGSDAEDDATAADRTVEVAMVDVAFEPATLTVAAGETVTFEFTNDGSVVHDAFIGDRHAQADHEEDMAEGGHHGEHGEAVTVDPGATERLTYTFAEPGQTEIGCHQPGHYGSGMKVDVTVT